MSHEFKYEHDERKEFGGAIEATSIFMCIAASLVAIAIIAIVIML